MKRLLFILFLFPMLVEAQGTCCDFSLVAKPPSGPNISINQSSLFFSSVTGTASLSQSINYILSSLTNPMAVVIPAGWEGSIDNGSTYHTGSFFSSLTVSGTLKLRVAASTAAGSYGPLDVTFNSTGATARTCSLSATVAAVSLSASPTSATLNGVAGVAGTSASTAVTFANLSGNITITTPSTPLPTEISTDNATFQTTPITYINTDPSPFTLYMRTTSAATAGSVSGTLTIAASGVSTVNITLSGTVTSAPTTIERFSFSLTSKTCTGWTNIFGDPHTGIRTGTGALTGWTYTSIATANYVPNGTNAFDNNGTMAGTFFSDCAGSTTAVMNNGWINGGAYDHTKPQHEIGGLNPAKTYNIKLTGSTNGGSLRVTDVRVEGSGLSSMISFTAKSNTANGVTFNNISPDGSGKIRIWFNQDVSNIEQGHCDAFTISENP